MNGNVHLFIEIAALRKTYECLFHRDFSIDENMSILMELIHNDTSGLFTYDSDTAVIEKSTGMICDRFVDLARLNVQDGMTLIVF